MQAFPNIEVLQMPCSENDVMSLIHYLREQPVSKRYRFIMSKNHYGDWEAIQVEEKATGLVQQFSRCDNNRYVYLNTDSNTISNSNEEWDNYHTWKPTYSWDPYDQLKEERELPILGIHMTS